MIANVKPFRSLSAIVALHQVTTGHGFDAIVLFDPPLIPLGGFPADLQGMGSHIGAITRKRRNRFDSVEEFVDSLRGDAVFGRVPHEVLNLFARTTLRHARDGVGFELRCPPEYEAQIVEHLFSWALTVEFREVRCPVKAIGSDPTVTYSFLPSTDLAVLVGLDYDFVPETSHLLQLEAPESCVALMVGFLKERGLA